MPDRRSVPYSCAAVAAAALVLTACGDEGPSERGPVAGPAASDPARSSELTVVLSDGSFDPDSARIAAGETVSWRWPDNDVAHNVAFADGRRSPTQQAGTWTRRFAEAGRYDYVCALHPNMKGTVVVS